MLGRELAASARRWSRIRDSKEGREGGGSVERRLRSDSSGDCEVEEEAIGRSNFLALLKRAATYQDEIDRQTPVLYGRLDQAWLLVPDQTHPPLSTQ